PLIPQSVGMFAYYLASLVQEERAKQFFTELARGEYAKVSVTHPPKVLRETLEQRNAEIITPTSASKLAWVVQAWNAYVANAPLRRLSRIVETLPTFDPDPLREKRK